MSLDIPHETPSAGQVRLEEHFAAFAELQRDFRGSSLNELIRAWVPAGRRVLDLGCGAGGLTAELLRQGCDVTSQDVSEAMVAMCRSYLDSQNLPSGGVRQGGASDLVDEGAFDTVVALDVIEHIEDDHAALLNMRRALKSTGELVLSVPALSELYGPKDEAIGHFRRYDRQPLLDMLARAGFEVQSVRYWNAIGVLPVWYSVKISKKRLDESMRYAGRSTLKRALNTALGVWFHKIENAVPMPLGLTLLVRAKPIKRG
jgi:SAM-dependent methyltransferase